MKALAVAAALMVSGTAVPSPGPAVSPPSAPQAPVLQAEHPLEQARRVAHEVPFSGTVEVRWRDGGQTHHDQFQVQAAGGSVMVDGRADPVLEMPERRLARAHGDDWELLWSPGLGPSSGVPDVSEKYDTVTLDEEPLVAGRTTSVAEIRDDGRPRVRLYLDEQTGLLLRRENLDESGRPERTVEFRRLSFDRPVPQPLVPPETSAVLARKAPKFRPAVASAAPDPLAEGYVRLGVYRRGAVVHAHYSDGLFEMSVFEQSGRLDPDELPGPGRRVSLGNGEGRLYAWPGGHVLVWQSGPVVRTAVSDAPAGEIVKAAQALPRPQGARPSLLEKLRRVGASLVDPLS